MELLSRHVIPDGTKQIRLLDYIIDAIESIHSRNGAKKAIKAGCITLDGETVESGRYVKPGQVIAHFKTEKSLQKVFEFEVPVVFEDEYMAVVNKPAGLSVSGNYFRTLQNALPYNLKPSLEPDALSMPRPVHRLDNQTSGLLVVAKTEMAAIQLGNLFEEKKVVKSYIALVEGLVEDGDVIDYPIEGKEARSEYQALASVPSVKYGHVSMLSLKPLTGRTHQLRIHLSQLGHPIIGDKLYGDEKLLVKGKGLFLSAVGIAFLHPILNTDMKFTLEIPNKFTAFMRHEKERFEFKMK